MKNFIELAQNRYTTKKYDSNYKIDNKTIEHLKEIIRLSPSSINSQPWKFSFVSDETLKNKLAEASQHNLQKIKDASHIIVFSVLDDVEKFEKHVESLNAGNQAYYQSVIKPKSEAEIKAWLKNQVYLSLGFFLSAVASLEIDSTPMEGIEPDKYKEILGYIDYSPVFAVALGKRDEGDINQPIHNPKSRRAIEDVIESI